MSLTILSDADVKSILYDLTRDEVEAMQKTLRDALHEYSTNVNNDKEECSFQQPDRQQLDRKNGTTTLFMPSTSSSGIGMKGIGPIGEIQELEADSGNSCYSKRTQSCNSTRERCRCPRAQEPHPTRKSNVDGQRRPTNRFRKCRRTHRIPNSACILPPNSPTSQA